jgi:TetR/AcrR family transcriptional regulator, transcriptional repressor of aconitase
MPKITQERRDARREQILEAARACVQEHGLEAVSMEMIISRSGLSTGAVYRYFKGKEEIMTAAVAAATAGLAQAPAPILDNPNPPPLPEFVGQVISTGVTFASRAEGIDMLTVAIHGWSHSQTEPGLRAATNVAYQGLRGRFAAAVIKWQEAGAVDPAADPNQIAQLILSICLGFVAQRALAGNADQAAHVAALAALTEPAIRAASAS